MSVNVEQKPTAVKNFAQLIMEIEKETQNVTSLKDIINTIISFNNRFPNELGLLSLDMFQQSIYKEAEHIQVEPKDSLIELSKGHYVVGMKPYGRIILEKYENKNENDCIFGFFKLTPVEEKLIFEVYQTLLIKETMLREEMEKTWASLSQDKHQMLFSNVKNMISHIDPITIYLDQQTFSLFGKHNNLLEERKSGSNHLFTTNERFDETKYNETERVFIYAMNLLKEAGCRSEEFNGLQLNLSNLNDYFDERLGYYNTFVLNNMENEEIGNNNLASKASRLKYLKQLINDDYQICRHINGLNFNKREFLYSKTALDNEGIKTFHLIKELVLSRAENKEKFDHINSAYDLFYAWLQSDIEVKNGDLSNYEELLNAIVALATEHLNADIGMSRGIRNFSKIKEITTGKISATEASEWPVTEFYCCVVPSEKMKNIFRGNPKNILFTIVNAISQRMDYNSWHYMPGHFEPASVPKDRDYYLPPRMPDTAEWSNLHHAGHVLANVLYSIRSPKEIVFQGKTFYGLCDLRVMRQDGEPFTEEVLATAIGFTDHIRALNQALLDYQSKENLELCIKGFNKPWYQERYKEL
ncbi:hypothetical protein ACINKY_08825 [Paenibacillus illinoisensis]|uniref:Uncharacterized protein n=1 Tax=Paenibacillus illinoisensis TaxID=59845 RepID=A0ABW8HRZ2_9BACL